MLIYAFRDILLALVQGLLAKNMHIKATPPEPSERTPGINTMFSLTASQIKEEAKRANESQDERLDRLEARIDECFRIEGQHRQELLDALKEVRTKLEKHRDRSNDKNESQDRLIQGLSQSIATIQGMIAARRGGTGSGVTQFLPDGDTDQ
jgi:hypothetical protein